MDVRELVKGLKDSHCSPEALQVCLDHLRGQSCDRARLESIHTALCSGLLAGIENDSTKARELLNYCGPAQTIRLAQSSVSELELFGAQWLAGEVACILTDGRLVSLLSSQTSPGPLSLSQAQLVEAIVRAPDCLGNRLARKLPLSLTPGKYFASLGEAIAKSLDHLVISHSRECVFEAALIGKAVILGHKDAILGPVLRQLLPHSSSESWGALSRSLFSLVPLSALEGTLETIITTFKPSLKPSLLHWLLGDLPLVNQRAKFILTHKFILVRVLSSPNAVYNLIGYLWLCDLLGETLEVVLGVWSDSSALRHMTQRQHIWLCSVLLLGSNCLQHNKEQLQKHRQKMQRLAMAGIEAHISSPLEAVRGQGMAVGEGLMSVLAPHSDPEKSLKFDYQSTDDIQQLLQLSRPVEQIHQELVSQASKPEPVEETIEPVASGRYGEGLVNTASDSDSDDDLVPYAMNDDPDSSQPRPPQYLRTLIAGLLASKDPLKMEIALKTCEKLVRNEPSDLSEVCVELSKILLHLSDTYALPDFVSLRLNSLTSLIVSRPRLVAPYLTAEFYSPHYNLRQRMDILEVASAGAQELSQPLSTAAQDRAEAASHHRKPWEEIIQERLRAKTRIISKGPRKAPPKPAPNRFAEVAPLFFYPLMASYDRPEATLDLLGGDSLVLGQLLYTLGSVMHAAVNAPAAPAMGLALLDFTWALRFHSAVY